MVACPSVVGTPMQPLSPPTSSRRHRPEPPQANYLRTLAFAHFALAGLSLLFHGFNNTVESSQADQRFAKALESVDNPQTQEMRKVLQRTLDLREGLRQHLAVRLPMSAWHGQADQLVEVITSLLLVAGGVALLRRQPVARELNLAYVIVSLGQKLFNLAYLCLFEVPISKAYLESILRLYPGDAPLIRGILDPLTTSPLYQVLFAAYPILVGALMLNPRVVAQLRPAEVPMPADGLPPEPLAGDGGAALNPASEAWTSFDRPSY
jgi:hypothetical protein